MKNILTIIKKEFSRFFRDRRLIVSLFLPGILIYIIYSLLGNGIISSLGGDSNYRGKIYSINAPENISTAFHDCDSNGLIYYSIVSPEEEEEISLAITNKSDEYDVLIVFPEHYSSVSDTKQTIKVIYNSSRTDAQIPYRLAIEILNNFMTTEIVETDLVSEKDATAMLFSTIAPMLILMLLFSGCISIAPESIAGEKERGTLGAILVSPVPRSHVAIGKIIALSVLSLASGLCSFLGVVLSLPKLMGNSISLSSNAYVTSDYIMLLGIILSSVLVMVALVSILSALAKSVKEATSMVGPLTIVVMLLGLSTFITSGPGSIGLYFIPLYNSARAMNGIFSFSISRTQIIITIIVNILAAIGLAAILTKMFDSEKIISGK